MRLADGLRKHGFRAWYSQELTHGHLHLLLLLLSAIGLFSTIELLGRRAPLADKLGSGALLLACIGLALWALRRYLAVLMRAEAIANQAVCRNCQAYGRLALVKEHLSAGQVTVSCRRCHHEWQITDLDAG